MKRISSGLFSALVVIMVFLATPVFAISYGTSTTGYSSVGLLYSESSGAAATGIAIADGWILTAGHVAGYFTAGDYFTLGAYGSSAAKYTVLESYTYSSFNISNLDNGYDFGLIKVSGLDLSAYPTLCSRNLGSGDLNRSVTYVGFGDDENGVFGNKLAGTGTISFTTARTFGVEGDSSGNSGDSGAPAFVDLGGGMIIVGTLSYVFDPESGGVTVFDSIYSGKSFIDGKVGAGVVNWGLSAANPVPVPGTLLLFAPGLAGLFALKRKNRG